MGQEVTNFSRFYSLAGKMPYKGEQEDLKMSLVSQFTGGRTTSLREMTRREYQACCDYLERKTGVRDELRRMRSCTLNIMQKMGVDTSDWTRVNALCEDVRIAGKPFAFINTEEHAALQRKLRGIMCKGGLRSHAETAKDKMEPARYTVMVTMTDGGAGN